MEIIEAQTLLKYLLISTSCDIDKLALGSVAANKRLERNTRKVLAAMIGRRPTNADRKSVV